MPVEATLCGNCGFQLASPTVNQVSTTNSSRSDVTALIGLVAGILGCVGWLIPLAGVMVGGIALVCGIIGLKSSRRIFALIGISTAIPVIAVSIFFWIKAAQHLQQATTSSAPVETVVTPCYSARLPGGLAVTQIDNSCTFEASSSSGSVRYAAKVVNVPSLTADTLAQTAQTDITSIVKSSAGSSITSEQTSTFNGNPAYVVMLKATDGSAGTVAYIYHATTQGNLVIVVHAEQNGKNDVLSSLEKSWSWR